MAERGEKSSEKGFLARTASITSKRAKRAQEKVKQKLGKANETKDVTFDEFVSNFNKQQAAAQRLQKDFKNYNTCIKAMLAAGKAFSEAIKEVYEPEWASREIVFQLLEHLHIHWTDLQEKLQEEVLEPLTAYQSQFPDIKARINKHGRKLVDYDRYRHNFEALKTKGKSVDPKKLGQCQEEFSEAKSVYTKLHAELYEELPALYDSRIAFYVSSFQSIFTAEGVFHREAAKIKTQMNDLMDGLVDELSSGTHTSRRPFQLSSANPISDSDEAEHISNPGQPEPQQGETIVCNDEPLKTENGEAANASLHEEAEEETETAQHITNVTTDALYPFLHSEHDELDVVEGETPAIEDDDQKPEKPEAEPRPAVPLPDTGIRIPTPYKPVVQPIPASRQSVQSSAAQEPSSPCEEPAADEIPGVIYKVYATHKYEAEDDDELSFDKGELIHVLEFDDPEEQDEGWLMGILDSSKQRGMFPANFTNRGT